ncbi:Septum formation protein Maf [Bacillus thuringiensis serovar israelensis ATCC 35646]|nr:Septum formation protein Maf [Bacillus thuringiensis serovar israelensis ATCC 35646]
MRKEGENMKKIILASGSPRRKELLELASIPFEIVVSEVEETIGAYSSPSDIVMSLALQKASAVAENNSDHIVLGADTIVTYESRILGKPSNEDEAKEMLQLLSGKTHEVYTGVAIISKEKTVTFYERTEVTFWELTEEEIDTYVTSKEPLDKAGSYGIQAKGSIFVQNIQGDYYSVVGLPMHVSLRELNQFDIDVTHA